MFPKVYSLLHMDGVMSFMTCVSAYSLEEASEKAIKNIQTRANETKYDAKNVRLSMYNIATLEDLFPSEISEVKDTKNSLMTQIIEQKDRTLYETNQAQFSEFEKKLIEEKLLP